ncbi:hypothetical protein CCR95_21930 [Thiocystis minor]|nr:hypothetical protein [Thiocystis minor]
MWNAWIKRQKRQIKVAKGTRSNSLPVGRLTAFIPIATAHSNRYCWLALGITRNQLISVLVTALGEEGPLREWQLPCVYLPLD